MKSEFRLLSLCSLNIEKLSFTLLIIFLFNCLSFAQWITNHDPVYHGNYSQPQYLKPFMDPNFGKSITRITNARTNGFAGIVPHYSKREAWNSDESLMILSTCSGETLLLNGTDYSFIRVLTDVVGEDIFWHPTDPSIIYYCPSNVLYSYNVNTDQSLVIHEFADYTFANTRGEGNLSRDGRYYAFAGAVYDNSTNETSIKDLVVYDISSNVIIKKLSLPPVLNDFDWVSISPLGNYVVVDYATKDAGRFNGVEVYDRMFNFIWQKPLGAGHSDLGIDETGNEFLIMGVYDEGLNKTIIKKFNLTNGEETALLDFSWSFDLHISCRNEARYRWCIISTFDGEGRLTDDNLSWLPFEDEVFALKIDGSGEVQRLAHHHSRRFSPDFPDRDVSNYYAEPHATVSRDGGRILFGSNWRENIGRDSSMDTYIIDFRTLLAVNKTESLPAEYLLLQNYPNPFNPSTVISYQIPITGMVQLKVYDLLGQEIKTLVNEEKAPGNYEVAFNGNDLSSGMYFYKLSAGNYSQTKKMMLVK